jgi:LacI family transcriptional regulator, repressor for deo operon, udp, cdd, tsx, nupC, and nupG
LGLRNKSAIIPRMTKASDSGRGRPVGAGITIRDVANRAGVSIGTVSRALKNQAGLGEDTRMQVLRAALELGYNTDNLRQNKIRRVSFVVGRLDTDVPANPFYSHVLHGVEDASREFEIVLQYLTLRPGDRNRTLEMIRRHEADALLCVSFFEPRMLERITGLGIPMVLVDHFAPGFPSVNMDNIAGAKLAVQHLVEAGKKRIAFVNGPGHYSIRQRLRGFQEALFEANMPLDPALVTMEVDVNQTPNIREQNQNAILELLALPNPPDAMFCWNDESALLAIRCCLEKGLRIPQDMAIVGFDDIDAAVQANPSLTTIRVNKELLGRRGLERLIDRKDDAESLDLIPVELVVRESTVATKKRSRAN